MLSLSFLNVLKAPPGGRVPGSSMLVNFDQGTLHSTEDGSLAIIRGLGNEEFLGLVDDPPRAHSDISPVSAPDSCLEGAACDCFWLLMILPSP